MMSPDASEIKLRIVVTEFGSASKCSMSSRMYLSVSARINVR